MTDDNIRHALVHMQQFLQWLHGDKSNAAQQFIGEIMDHSQLAGAYKAPDLRALQPPLRIVITSHDEGDTLASGDTITIFDFEPDGSTYDFSLNGVDQGPSSASLDHVLHSVPSGPLQICVYPITNGIAQPPYCYSFVGAETNTAGAGGGVCVAGPNDLGKLWGGVHAISANSDWACGVDNSRGSVRHGIPFRAEGTRVDTIKLYFRNAGSSTSYTKGNGGTYRSRIVNDDNGKPGNTTLSTSPEYTGDATKFANEAAFLAAYPGATWMPPGMHTHAHTNTTVVPGNRYWIVIEQVRGGYDVNWSSPNYMRSGSSADYAINWLTRSADPCADTVLLPMKQNQAGQWSVLMRHPTFSVEGNFTVGQPGYNLGSAPDDEPDGNDRHTNVNSSDRVRNVWTFSGTRRIKKIHVCAARNSGSGNLEIRINGSLAGTIPVANFPQAPSSADQNASVAKIMEQGRYVALTLSSSITVTDSATFELTAPNADLEMGHVVEGNNNFAVASGSSGSPDVQSQYQFNNGSWSNAPAGMKYAIAWNELADGTAGNCLNEQCTYATGMDVSVPVQPSDPEPLPPAGVVGTVGKLWGGMNAISAVTDWGLAVDNDRASVRQAIPFRAEGTRMENIKIYPRNAGIQNDGYTYGNGGTWRTRIVADNNGQPSNTTLSTSAEYVGDPICWNEDNPTDFAAAYPGAAWHRRGMQTHVHGLNVVPGQRYWIVMEQVRGGSVNRMSPNYMRSGDNTDYAANWLKRFSDPTADTVLLPMIQNAAGQWSVFNRHPCFSVQGGNFVAGQPGYWLGTHIDPDGNIDRHMNVSSTGSRIRSIWTVPDGAKTIGQIHFCAARVSGTGNVEFRVNGNLVGTIPVTNYGQVPEDAYYTQVINGVPEQRVYMAVYMEIGRYQTLNLAAPLTLTGTAVFEVSAPNANLQVGQCVEGNRNFIVAVGTSGAPDVRCEYQIDNGSWTQSPNSVQADSGTRYALAWNEVVV